MDYPLITVLLIASLICMAINATIFNKTLKGISDDPGLKPFFTYLPGFNVLATLACIWITLEDKYNERRYS